MDLFNELSKLKHPTYEEAGRLYQWGTSATSHFLNYLGNPQLDYPVIHITGTNGKGSVCCYLASALIQLGYSVGTYNSPHFYNYRERIKLNGEAISSKYTARFLQIYISYKSKYPNYIKSYAELFPVIAFWYFKQMSVDFAIIESGIGGLNDPTNIDCHKILTIITSIGLDHTELFGENIIRIIKEKIGICRPRIPLILGNISLYAKQILINCLGLDIPYEDSSKKDVEIEDIEEYDLGGEYLYSNIKTTISALNKLRPYIGETTNNPRVDYGLKHAGHIMNYHGRWESISRKPKVIIDVCGNAFGLQKIFERLSEMRAGGNHSRLVIILGISSIRKADILKYLPTNAEYYFLTSSMRTPKIVGE